MKCWYTCTGSEIERHINQSSNCWAWKRDIFLLEIRFHNLHRQGEQWGYSERLNLFKIAMPSNRLKFPRIFPRVLCKHRLNHPLLYILEPHISASRLACRGCLVVKTSTNFHMEERPKEDLLRSNEVEEPWLEGYLLDWQRPRACCLEAIPSNGNYHQTVYVKRTLQSLSTEKRCNDDKRNEKQGS